jgi:hypothetical protein
MLDTILIDTRPSPDRFDADQKCRLPISGSERYQTKAPAFRAGVFGTQTNRALGGSAQHTVSLGQATIPSLYKIAHSELTMEWKAT